MIFLLKPLPRWKGLFIHQDRADRILIARPEAYSIDQSAEAAREWNALLKRVEILAQGDNAAHGIAGLPADAAVRGLLRRIHSTYEEAYRFARMVQTVKPNRHRFILAAPQEIRDLFIQQGLPIHRTGSVLAWAGRRLSLLVFALLSLMRHSLYACMDGRSTDEAVSEARGILWLGLTPAELRTEPGALNALDFIREGPLALFQTGAPVYISTPWRNAVSYVDDVKTTLGPHVFRRMPARPFRVRDAWQLIRDSAQVFMRVIHDMGYRGGLFMPIAPDAAQLPRMRLWFQRAQPRAVVISNSMYAYHPLWLAYAPAFGGEAVMIFYSTNSLPFYYQAKPDPLPGDPAYRLLDCTRFEVWTEGHKRWLMSIGVPEFKLHVAGILIWGRYKALREPGRSSKSRPSPLRIGLFDVIPMRQGFWTIRGVGDLYYDSSRMCRFIRDIVATCRETLAAQGYELLLKSKRDRMPDHDPEYAALLRDLFDRGELKAVPPGTNPIDAVAACDLVLSIPFSSPSVIAAHMKIPTAYYDASYQLRPSPTPISPEIPVLQNRAALTQWMLDSQRVLCAS